MANAVVIDDKVRYRLKAIKLYAETHIYTLDELEEMDKYPEDVDAAEMAKYRTTVPFNLCVCYVIETQLFKEEPMLFRHLSMYIHGQRTVPNVFAVEMIMEEFGFKSPLRDCHKFLADNNTIVHVMEKYEQ